MGLTTYEEFAELAKQGTFVPVWKEAVADLLTPLSAFLCVARDADCAFLLESVGGGQQTADYSFLGKDPFLVLRARGDRTIVNREGTITESDRPYLEVLREVMEEYHSPAVPGLPRFKGGAVGYLGYDSARWFESVPLVASPNEDDALFMLFDTILAFDHVRHRIVLIANVRLSPRDDLRLQYDSACDRIELLQRELERGFSWPKRGDGKIDLKSNMTRGEFEGMVQVAKEHIAAGDIYQVVLSQRFETPITDDPIAIYRGLWAERPSPYMYLLRMGDKTIVGASPEMLVQVVGDTVKTHPIAGTRPRGVGPVEDDRLANELLDSEKERSEHVMLVDLGRNDLGRVCEYGSVKVTRQMEIERYANVMHLVSEVRGTLAAGKDRLDALASCFPAGTVSGAPKVRAIEIIDQLEPDRRGVYAGAVGYLDFAGNMDCCITIRTIVIENGVASVQAGAGVVADSDPTAEYQETLAKAASAFRALAGPA